MKILRKRIRWGKEQTVAIPSKSLSHILLQIHYVIETNLYCYWDQLPGRAICLFSDIKIHGMI